MPNPVLDIPQSLLELFHFIRIQLLLDQKLSKNQENPKANALAAPVHRIFGQHAPNDFYILDNIMIKAKKRTDSSQKRAMAENPAFRGGLV